MNIEPTEQQQQLSELRREIGQKTSEILRLIGERNELATLIGRTKTKDALPIEDGKVEDQLYLMVQRECERLGIDKRAGAKILGVLLSESKRVQGGQDQQPRVLITPMVIASKARELERKGEKLIRLDIGEPDFHPPRAVLDACSDALYGFKTHYTGTKGIPALLEALQRYLKNKHGFSAQESQLMVTPGGRFGVYAALSTLLAEGDRCIIIEPNWPAYREIIQFLGARASVIPTSLEEGWEPSLERVKDAIGPTTKAIVLSYPGNPTGKLVSPRKFDELVGIANENGVTVISDEIYTEYSYKECPTILKSRAEKFILTASFSKTWAMTGFRVGYSVSSSQEMIARMTGVQALTLTSVAEFIQYAAIKALEVEGETTRENSRLMKERIELASTELDKLPEIEYYKPDGAMYVFPRVKIPGFDASSFTMELLEQKKVSITPGSGFGEYPDFFRISLGNSNEMISEGIKRLGEAVRR